MAAPAPLRGCPGAWSSRRGSPDARHWLRPPAAGGRPCADRRRVRADRAAQGTFHALGHGREMRLAVERRENGAAHQGRAAQAGQDRSGKPLGRDAAAIDRDAGAAIDGQRRLVAKIDAIDLAPWPRCRAPSVVQFAVPLIVRIAPTEVADFLACSNAVLIRSTQRLRRSPSAAMAADTMPRPESGVNCRSMAGVFQRKLCR